MGRYLLIEFDDNDSADRMRAQINAAEANGRRFRVIGMYTKASTMCECTTRSDKSVRGSKFGWWLCPECRKPKSGAPQMLRNLLDDKGTPAKYLDLLLSVRWFKKDGRVITARSLKKEHWK